METSVDELALHRPRPIWLEVLLYFFWYLPGFLLLCLPVLYLFNRTRIRGRKHLPRQGGALILANHLSSLDPWFVGHALFPRPMWFPAKEELFSIPVVRWMILGWRAFPVRRRRGDEVGRNRIAALARRYYVCLFPEGTRSRDGRLGTARRGAARVVLRARTTTIPARIEGLDKLVPVGARFIRFGNRLRLTFGEPIDLEPYLAEGETEENLDRLGAEIMTRLQALGELEGDPGL